VYFNTNIFTFVSSLHYLFITLLRLYTDCKTLDNFPHPPDFIQIPSGFTCTFGDYDPKRAVVKANDRVTKLLTASYLHIEMLIIH